MAVEILSSGDQWPENMGNCEFPRLAGHSRLWFEAVGRGLKHPYFVLVCKNHLQNVDGILPVMLVKSRLFGRFLVSCPYINTGGVWATDSHVAGELVSYACDLADQYNVRYLELRHEVPVAHPKLTVTRRDKVHMRLALPGTELELDQSFKSKLRSQIKKSSEYGLELKWGGHELLEDYYHVFARNMRDLGTPVFSKNLFRQILNHFDGCAELCVVRRDHKPIASALLVHQHGVTEVPSASSLREHNCTNANMWMYRHLLGRALERGSHTFDFGRSSEGSGTYKFKSQWNAHPYPAVWQYYVRQGSAEDMRPESESKQRLIRLWMKLPVWVTRWVGPSIVRGIP